MFSCAFSSHVWDGCAKRVGTNINFILDCNLCDKLGKENPHTPLMKTLFAVFCWNIWAEKNSRTFHSVIHSINYCIRQITHNTALWPSIASDEERLQLLGGSLDEDLYGSQPSLK